MDIFEIGTAARTAEVTIPTPGGDATFLCKSVSIGVKSKIESIISKPEVKSSKDCTEMRWIALSNGVFILETGEPAFTRNQRSEFNKLESWFVEPLFEKILELSGVTGKDREDFEGN